MANNDWIDKVHDRLVNQTIEPPQDLWDKIDASLDKQRRQIRLLWVRRFAAAAVVLGIVAMGAVFFFNRNDGVSIAKLDDESIPTMTTNDLKSTAEKSSTTDGYDVVEKNQSSSEKLLALVRHDERSPLTVQKESFDDAKGTLSDSERTPLETQKESFENVQEIKPENKKETTQKQKSRDLPTGEAWVSPKSNRSTQNRWSIGAHTSNVFASNNSMNNVMMASEGLLTAAKPNTDFMLAAQMPTVRYEKKKHHQPIQVGLTASYSLSDKVSVASGVVYTSTSSEFTRVTGNSEMVDEQSLHYVGVPVNVNYKVWQTKRFKTYVGAGGQADFNVSATVKTEGVKSNMAKDKVQWSVNATAGAQYDIVPKLGVYVEPGVKYYIDNGSNVENVFKSRPCSFSLQVGVRYDIK